MSNKRYLLVVWSICVLFGNAVFASMSSVTVYNVCLLMICHSLSLPTLLSTSFLHPLSVPVPTSHVLWFLKPPAGGALCNSGLGLKPSLHSCTTHLGFWWKTFACQLNPHTAESFKTFILKTFYMETFYITDTVKGNSFNMLIL